ncbi:hypothetical protein C5167_007815, partial [Papaver somniferum]
AGNAGVNYGRNGNNLPSPTEVVKLLRSRNVDRIRLFSPDSDALNALQGSGIQVVLGVPNPDVQRIGIDPEFARNWVNNNVLAFNDIEIPSAAASNAILPAMKNLNDALTAAGKTIAVSTTINGWPSAENGNIATIQNASTYINNLISHVSGTSGTPKRPGKSIETYIFALFNENIKPGARDEQHFGLYYPDMREVYPVTF